MALLENILYGIISGITEFLPVSSRGHQALLSYLFGGGVGTPLQNLVIHISILLSVFVSCREDISRLYRQQQTLSIRRSRRSRITDPKSYYELRLLKTAVMPLFIGMFFYIATAKLQHNLPVLMLLLLLNGFILLVAEHTRHGNRDARTLSGLDGIVVGILGAASVFPGISRTAMITTYTSIRGADGQNAANWAILLGIPAMIFAFIYDLLLIINSGFGVVSFSTLICVILSGAAAFCGSYLGIAVLRLVLPQFGFSKFAYYSIGTAMFTFALYLLT